MQKTARLSFALLLLFATTTFAPPMNALPCQDIITTYYDCALNEVGHKYRFCSGNGSDDGTLSGAFREIETNPCDCGSYTDTWYQWNGSSWVTLSGPPSPTC
ncbi:MAG TPA: hypothetical protein VGR95_17840 [Thermoanaerobaculia bacterium]|jgi:hypothetical protein|nr:hypothetical protein [Thermoanaerobaculia bacterium]